MHNTLSLDSRVYKNIGITEEIATIVVNVIQYPMERKPLKPEIHTTANETT